MANRERVVAALVLLFVGLTFSGCSVQAPPELFTAIREADLDQTKTILQTNPKSVNSKDESGDTPLILAARMGNKDLCEVLVANGANLEAQGQHGTALHEAAIGNHKDIVELLINRGANVNAKDKSGNTPLYYASTFGEGRKRTNKNDWDIARSLVSRGAKVNMKPGSDDTPLHSAALYAPKEIVRLFLDNGADVNVKVSSTGSSGKPNGPTPLHNACMRADKNTEILELLIAAGADINAKCYSDKADGWTPLFFACVHENTKAVELLIANRAKIYARSESGSTPMHYATNVEIAEILIDNRANLHFKDKEGNSPLHNAVKAGRMDVAKLLIANRAYVTTINNQGTSLLHEAAITNQKEMIELLIDEGVNINAKDRAGKTAAQLAEKAGHDDIADFLRSYDAK